MPRGWNARSLLPLLLHRRTAQRAFNQHRAMRGANAARSPRFAHGCTEPSTAGARSWLLAAATYVRAGDWGPPGARQSAHAGRCRVILVKNDPLFDSRGAFHG